MPKKTFALSADQIKPLAMGLGGCIATDTIAVRGHKVGYMSREEPRNRQDSGWAFSAGTESQAYMDDSRNLAVYDVNTIANVDPDIIPFLGAPYGSEFKRQDAYGGFIQVAGKPWKPGDRPARGSWPPPGFPVVEGAHQLTERWSIWLPERFARRIEEDQMVLWRPGLTIWLSAWHNDAGETLDGRLADLKLRCSPERFGELEHRDGKLLRYSYRLREASDDDGAVESLYAYVIAEQGHLEMAIYFDDPADEALARRLAEQVSARG